jgi:hypothetical protein
LTTIHPILPLFFELQIQPIVNRKQASIDATNTVNGNIPKLEVVNNIFFKIQP